MLLLVLWCRTRQLQLTIRPLRRSFTQTSDNWSCSNKVSGNNKHTVSNKHWSTISLKYKINHKPAVLPWRNNRGAGSPTVTLHACLKWPQKGDNIEMSVTPGTCHDQYRELMSRANQHAYIGTLMFLENENQLDLIRRQSWLHQGDKSDEIDARWHAVRAASRLRGAPPLSPNKMEIKWHKWLISYLNGKLVRGKNAVRANRCRQVR